MLLWLGLLLLVWIPLDHPAPDLFFFRKTLLRGKSVMCKRKTKKQTRQSTETERGQPHSYANLSSLRTSCAEGASSPVPGDGQRSNEERANDLAALHARIALHRRNQADSILPWSAKGALCARALVREHRN